MKRIAEVVFLFCLAGCAVAADEVAGLGVDLKNTTPLQLLEKMREHAGPNRVISIEQGVPGTWVREADLPKLIELMDSNAACAPIKLTRSSSWPQQSTVGEQAALMIEGFRVGRYPPGLNTYQVSPAKKQELIAWWKARSSSPATN